MEPPICWVVLARAPAMPLSAVSTRAVARLVAAEKDQPGADPDESEGGQDDRGMSWRGAGRRFFDPGGLPGPGLPGLGAPAGQQAFARMFRNPRRTRAGVSRPGGAGDSQGRRRSAASGRARRSWA